MAEPIVPAEEHEESFLRAAEYLQAGLDRLNKEIPPTYDPMPFLANYRHPCMSARQAKMSGRGVSTAIDLKERYVQSWDGDESYDEGVAIIYREGRCKSCGQVARSGRGRVVRTDERPPVTGRVGRE